MTKKTAILVTGMHRSGTSALARTLSLLGATLPKDIIPPNEGNPDGHWEPQGMVDLNDRMLADAGSEVYGIPEIEPDWFHSSRVVAFLDEAVALIGTSFDGESLIVLKDPRTALMLPVWEAALDRSGYRTVHVLPLRHPEDVAESLRRRHLKSIPYDGWTTPRGETVWLRYTLAGVRGSRGRARCFVNYDDFIRDWRSILARVAAEADIEWPRSGADADRAVEAFLRQDPPPKRSHLRKPVPPPADLATLNLVELASTLYTVLSDVGDYETLIDAIFDVYHDRVFGVRDLILAFEKLYPLVWHYYEESRQSSDTLRVGLRREAQWRSEIQQLWSTLNQSNEARVALRIDLCSANKRANDFEHALQTDVGVADLTNQFQVERQRTEDELAALRSARDQLQAERQLHDSEKASLLVDMQELQIQIEAERQQLEGERTVLADEYENFSKKIEAERQQFIVEKRSLDAENSQLLTSRSWRITRPVRAISRLVRGRP